MSQVALSRVSGIIAPSMARKRDPKGIAPMYFVNATYKLWLRAELERRGWTYDRLADEVKKANGGKGVTPEALHLLVGKLDDAPVDSNTSWLPAINKALGLPPPEIFDPSKPVTEETKWAELLARRWPKMTPRERQLLKDLLSEQEPES